METNDREIFDAALAPEAAPAPEPVATPQPSEPIRDEQGRFAPKSVDAPQPEAQPEATPQPEQSPGHVPSFRLKEEAEARRKADERAQMLERELMAIRQQLASQQPKEPPAPPPSLWENEQEWANNLIQPVHQTLQEQREYFSRKLAVKEHGAEAVQDAYNAMAEALQRRDHQAVAAYQRAMNSPDPYEEIMGWRQQNRVLQEVGSDPNAWLEKKLEERMNDPSFLAKALERARATAGQQQVASGTPSTIQLPPSLNTARGAAPSPANAPGDMSDRALFAHATRR